MVSRRALIGTCAVLGALVLAPSLAMAQTGSIAGVVKDTTGSILPGVMVEASSPALIEKVRTATTDEKGQYKIIDLRPGIYTVKFTLPGFSIVKREGIELTTQFTAPVSAELRVGAITETVTVMGESPVVDTQRVQQVKVMTRDVIDAVPTGKTFQNIGVLVPGVVVGAGGTGATPYDVGGSSGEQQVQMAIHGGATADMVVQMDGMRFNNLCGSGSYTGVSGNDGGVEQIAFETGAISAEMGTGGIRVNLIPKDGGNTFKGGFFLNGTTGSFQSNNLTADLTSQGLKAVNTMKRVWDVNGSLGGPVLKNKLWFYFASRYWGLDKYPADSFYDADPRYFAYAPDTTRQGVDDSWNISNATRLTWQATPRNKFTAYVDLQDRLTGHWFIGQGGIFGLTTPEASWIQTTPINHLIQSKWTSTVSSRMLNEAGVSIYTQEYTRLPQPDVSPSTLSVRDNATGRRINAAPYYSEHWSTLRTYTASMSYVTGSHAAKIGMNLSEGPRHEKATVNGDMTSKYTGANPTQVISDRLAPRRARAPERRPGDLRPGSVDGEQVYQERRHPLRLPEREARGSGVPGRHVRARAHFSAKSRPPELKDLGPRLGPGLRRVRQRQCRDQDDVQPLRRQPDGGLRQPVQPARRHGDRRASPGTGADTRIWTDPSGDRIVQPWSAGRRATRARDDVLCDHAGWPTWRRVGSTAATTGESKRVQHELMLR